MFASLKNPIQAGNNFLKCHQWIEALQVGLSKEEVAEFAFNFLTKDFKQKAGEANGLKIKFNQISKSIQEHMNEQMQSSKKIQKREKTIKEDFLQFFKGYKI